MITEFQRTTSQIEREMEEVLTPERFGPGWKVTTPHG